MEQDIQAIKEKKVDGKVNLAIRHISSELYEIAGQQKSVYSVTVTAGGPTDLIRRFTFLVFYSKKNVL